MAKKPSILFLAPLPPPVHGSSMVSEIIRRSAFLNEVFSLDFVNLSTSRRMDEIQKFSIWKVGRFIGTGLTLFQKLITRHHDACCILIACHGVPFLKDALLVLLCKAFRQNVILYQHNKGMSLDMHKPLYRWLFRVIYHQTHVILLSWSLYPDVEPIVNREQILVCPNGIPDIGTNLCLERPRSPIPHLLFLSNLIESKGILVLLEACKILQEKGISFVCDVVGGETQEISADRFHREIQSRNLQQNVLYHGAKYGKDKETCFQKADLFVFPTFYPQECFPLTLLEAMQHGLPCVTSHEGAIPEIIQDSKNGLLCDPMNPASVAQALETLLKDPTTRLKMGLEGRQIYCEHFTLSHFETCLSACLLKWCNPPEKQTGA